nr:chemotaxis protein CheC [Thermosinus carboxydivorans]
MLLTQKQEDAVTEIINIAFHRTAAALSEIIGRRVLLDRPQLRLETVGRLAEVLKEMVGEEVATVQQIFEGPFAGSALLLFRRSNAVALGRLFAGEEPRTPDRIDEMTAEVLTEVGNILLNACIGMLGNLFKVQVFFSVPRLRLESLDALVKTLVIGGEELRYAVVVFTRFHVADATVNGYIIIVLGITSLENLLEGIDRLEQEIV